MMRLLEKEQNANAPYNALFEESFALASDSVYEVGPLTATGGYVSNDASGGLTQVKTLHSGGSGVIDSLKTIDSVPIKM